jgi:hypothetical protein
MQLASSALAVAFAAVLALWPVAFLAAVLMHAFARRWKRVGQVAFLLPLWTIAASVGLMQLTPFVAALNASPQGRSPVVPIVAVVFAMCCAAVAWALLLRAFDRRTDSGEATMRTPPA